MLREMEHDADRYEVALVGGDVFESTALRIRVLAVARQEAQAMSMGTWREGRACATISATWSRAWPTATRPTSAPRSRSWSTTASKGCSTRTRPTPQRIASAKAAGSSGTFRLDGPASALLGDDHQVSRQATVRLYEAEPEIRTRPYQLRPAQRVSRPARRAPVAEHDDVAALLRRAVRSD